MMVLTFAEDAEYDWNNLNTSQKLRSKLLSKIQKHQKGNNGAKYSKTL